MNFKVPDYKFKDGVWFLSEEEKVLYGVITMITMCMTEGSTSIYYGVEINDETNYTIRECDIIPHMTKLIKPLYEPGDVVAYKIFIDKTSTSITSGKIAEVEITMYTREQCEVVYIMEDDADYWVLEDDIIGFVDSKLPVVVEQLPPLPEDDEEVTVRDYCGV